MEENTVVEQEGLSLDDATQEAPEQELPKKEPGYVKKRIEAAVSKERESIAAQVRAELKAEYEAQIRPLREAQLTREADELVKEGEFKSKERALEYLRLKQGLPVPPVAPVVERPRNEQGQFATEIPPEIAARAERLLAQAEYAKKKDGIDPMEIYQSNPEIAEKVNSGEWDFADVVINAQRKVPSPIRTSNAAQPQKRGPLELTPEEFKRLEESLKRGSRVDMR